MSNLIVPDTNFAASRLANEPWCKGFPVIGAGYALKGLWLFPGSCTGAPVGQAASGPWTDYSHNGHDAVIWGGRAAPVQRAGGLEISDPDGLILSAGISADASAFTVIFGVRVDTPPAETGVTTQFFTSTANAIPENKAQSHNVTPFPVPAMRANPVSGHHFFAWDLNADIFESDRALVTGGPDYGEAGVFAYGVDGAGERARMDSLQGDSGEIAGASPSSISAYFGGLSAADEYLFGAFPVALRTSTDPWALISGFAIYEGYLDDETRSAAMQRMSAIMGAQDGH